MPHAAGARACHVRGKRDFRRTAFRPHHPSKASVNSRVLQWVGAGHERASIFDFYRFRITRPANVPVKSPEDMAISPFTNTSIIPSAS